MDEVKSLLENCNTDNKRQMMSLRHALSLGGGDGPVLNAWKSALIKHQAGLGHRRLFNKVLAMSKNESLSGGDPRVPLPSIRMQDFFNKVKRGKSKSFYGANIYTWNEEDRAKWGRETEKLWKRIHTHKDHDTSYRTYGVEIDDFQVLALAYKEYTDFSLMNDFLPSVIEKQETCEDNWGNVFNFLRRWWFECDKNKKEKKLFKYWTDTVVPFQDEGIGEKNQIYGKLYQILIEVYDKHQQ